MNNRKKKPSFVDKYIKMRPTYEASTRKYELLIKDLIEESRILVHSITSRTKEVDSFSSKLSRDIEKPKELSDITDLSGVRICCYFSSQVEEVAKLIKKNFTVIPELSVDKRETIDSDRFGYLSLHYMIRFANKRAQLPEYEKYKDLLCEIQIRTILQHAWAEIEHDLGYKSTIEIPRTVRRQFSRLASLLELADEQFDNIKLQIESYSREIEKKIISKPKEVAIDKISVRNYIMTSSLIKHLDDEIAKTGGVALADEIDTETVVKMCDYLNIKSIQELESVAKKEKDNIIKFIKAFLGEYGLTGPEVVRGISLFYLGYLLILQQKNIESLKDYLKSEIGIPVKYIDGIADMIIEAKNKID